MRFREDELQKQVAKYLDYLGVLWFHPANERKTSKQAGARLKAKGVKSGVPDILIFNHNKDYNGLAIELKIKPNKLSENQIKWGIDLMGKNWLFKTCYSFDDSINIIDDYLKNNH